MATSTGSTLTASQQAAARALAGDLDRVFGGRLRSVVAYGLATLTDDEPVHTLALVDRCTFEDLAACLPSVPRWQAAGLAVPLLLGREEFARSLDAFPLEYGGIVADHVVVAGPPPFGDVRLDDADLRRACERQAKSHLIHLREGYLETAGAAPEMAALVQRSAAPFRALLAEIARLTEGAAPSGDDALAAFAERVLGVRAGLVREVLASGRAASAIAEPSATLAPYIAASERVWSFLDSWPGR